MDDEDGMGPFTQLLVEDGDNVSMSQQANFRPLDAYMPVPRHSSRHSREESAVGPSGSLVVVRQDGGAGGGGRRATRGAVGKVFADNVHGTFRWCNRCIASQVALGHRPALTGAAWELPADTPPVPIAAPGQPLACHNHAACP